MLLTGPITVERFGDLDLSDPFFDSLKSDYQEFPDWFKRKHDNEAWVLRNEQGIQAFLYLKEETGSLDDVEPPRPAARRMKAGTMKVEARGTRLGERFLRLMFDQALERHVEEIYVTVFPKHEGLINLLTRWGFSKEGTKSSPNGVEDVYVRPNTLDGAKHLQRLSVRKCTREAQALAGDLSRVSYAAISRLEAPNRVK
jgi:L-amino acid N-acyltransferase YncA